MVGGYLTEDVEALYIFDVLVHEFLDGSLGLFTLCPCVLSVKCSCLEGRLRSSAPILSYRVSSISVTQ